MHQHIKVLIILLAQRLTDLCKAERLRQPLHKPQEQRRISHKAADRLLGVYTGFGQLLMGLTEDSIDWTSTNLTTEKSYDHTDKTVRELHADILAVCGKLREGNWTVDVKIDGEVVISFNIHAAE